MKFHRGMNLTALLVTILGSRNKNKHSEFWYLTFQRYLLYKFRLKKDKPWIFLSKFRCRTILMFFLLLICGKFTRAQLAHQIFLSQGTVKIQIPLNFSWKMWFPKNYAFLKLLISIHNICKIQNFRFWFTGVIQLLKLKSDLVESFYPIENCELYAF
jgi:hypothetical protein